MKGETEAPWSRTCVFDDCSLGTLLAWPVASPKKEEALPHRDQFVSFPHGSFGSAS